MSPAWRGMVALCIGIAAWSLGADALAAPSYAGANRAYQEQRYTEAISGYEAIIAAGVVHEHLYYNLGNAYFRAGDLGRAAYNYERVLRLAPGFDDARHNLAVVRDAVAGTTDTPSLAPAQPSRVFTAIPPAWLVTAFIIANIVFFAGLVALRIRARSLGRRRLRAATGLAGAAFVMSAVLLLGRLVYVDGAELGVVLPAEVEMREGPDSAGRASVRAGARVRILDGASEWLKVRLDSGVEGWLPRDAIGRL